MRKLVIVQPPSLCRVLPVQEAAVSHLKRIVSGPEALEDALRGANIDVRLLVPSSGFSELQRIHLPRACLDTVRLSSPILVSGEMAADCCTLIYVNECPRDGHSFNFARKHRSGYMGFFAPGGVLDAMTPAGYANATLTVPLALFHQELPRRCPGLPEDWLRDGGSLCLSGPTRQRFASLLAAKDEMERDAPAWLHDPAVRAGFEEDLLTVFLEALNDRTGGQSNESGTVRITRRYGAISRIRAHISDHRGTPLRLSELCEASGMSRRGLEYLFKDLFGIGVNAFVRCQRLHGARREILASDPEPGCVKKIALNWGFWHLGRFAAEYKRMFGESPVDSLRMKAMR